MAAPERLVEDKRLKMDLLQSFFNGSSDYSTRYDQELDTLFIWFTASPAESVAHYMDDNLALLYTPRDMEVVGLQIEDFKVFAGKHDALNQAWNFSLNVGKLESMENLYAWKDKQERKVIREVAQVTKDSLYSAN